MYRLCRSCSKRFKPDPRVPEQQYCSKTDCQKERRRLWINQKRSTDPDYKGNQADAQKSWMQKNPTYWREYRERNPEYVRRNRAMQKKRNATRKNASKANNNRQHRIAKMNEWTVRNVISSGCFRVPEATGLSFTGRFRTSILRATTGSVIDLVSTIDDRLQLKAQFVGFSKLIYGSAWHVTRPLYEGIWTLSVAFWANFITVFLCNRFFVIVLGSRKRFS